MEAVAASSTRGGVSFPAVLRDYRALTIAWLLAFALVTRASVFGDAGYTNDELFYFWVGQRAHEGLLPYVDIWDRKGPGLFLTYYLIAGVSYAVVTYQIAALLAATATAYVICRCVDLIGTRIAAVFAGTLYLAMLPLYGGGGGQSPVFYNFFIAFAALMVLRSRPEMEQGSSGWRLYLAMASAGFAITFKQCAFVEAAFFGCYCVWQLHRGGLPLKLLILRASTFVAVGAAPMLLFTVAFAIVGHFEIFWQAIVESNLDRTNYPAVAILSRAGQFVIYCSPPAVAAIIGRLSERAQPWLRQFLTGWLLASFGGIAIMLNFFDHYALPFMVPTSVAASLAVTNRQVRPVVGAIIICLLIGIGPAFKFEERRQSREALANIVAVVQRHDPHPRLMVFEGPAYLYRLLNSTPLSPLQFPTHLYHPFENNVGPFDTADEVRKILAAKPTVVTVYAEIAPGEENQSTAPLVRSYLRHCQLWFRRRVREVRTSDVVAVYGDCSDRDQPKRHRHPA